MNIPARYFSGYAYQLNPPDFHACFESDIGGQWLIFDATRLVPLNGLVRIGTGRDAADASVASIFGGAQGTSVKVDCQLADGERFKPLGRQQLNHKGISLDSNDAENMLLALCQSIHETFKYQRRYSKGVQTPTQTLKLGTGSCRDLATLMMDAARSLGLAARFVSGYLDCPASEAGRASMHAWTEVYLPILGWRGFDPTLGEAVSLKHIFVAASHHPRGVMPVSGLFTGSTSAFLEMNAHVKIDRLD